MNTSPNASFHAGRRALRDGFALVLVLVILSLMAIIAVGYLSSMASERATAGAFSNKVRAEQAAQAGVDSAVGILRDYFKAFPDSVTSWDTAQSTNLPAVMTSQGYPATNEGTTLYLRAVPLANDSDTPDPAAGSTDPNFPNADFTGGNGPNNVDATTGVDNRKIFALPLVSGATVKQLPNKAKALPTPVADNSTAANAVDLNARRQIGDTQGWLGTPPGYAHAAIKNVSDSSTFPKPFPVPWVEIKQSERFPDPTQAPTVGRYAFWVEDESFRANINFAGLGKDLNHVRRDNTALPPSPINPTDADLLGLLDAFAPTANPPATDPSSPLAKSIYDTRAVYPGQLFPELGGLAHSGALADPKSVNALRYWSTTQSSALNLSRHGTQRLSLNDLIPANTKPDDTGTTQKQVDAIVRTIQFHAPNFGQRLYRNAPSTGIITDPSVLNAMSVTHDPNASTQANNYAKLYNYKIAANLRDYLDNDPFPTLIMAPSDVHNNGVVRTPTTPTIPFGDNGDNTVWAIGKDSAPFLQECAVRYSGTITPPAFVMNIDYYIEVWNMSTKDVLGTDLGKTPFIRISNPTRWQVNNSAKIPKNTVGNTTDIAVWTSAADLISDDADKISPSDTRPTNTKRDFNIDITNEVDASGNTVGPVKFPAGQVTVITTDKNYATYITDSEAINNHRIILCKWAAGGKSTYKGHFPEYSPGVARPAVGKDVLDMVFDTNTAYGSASTSSDYETDVTMGSELGYVDCLEGALPLSWGGRIDVPYTGGSSNFPVFFGGVMRGNWTNTSSKLTEGMQASALGDPRTNNEQLVYSLDPKTFTVDRSRWSPYEIASGSNTLTPTVTSPANGIIPTLGLANYRSVRPNRPENPWGDYPAYYVDPNNPTQAELSNFRVDRAPMPVANAALISIGQLGDLFDPSRIIEGGNTGGSRGGGRSLKIGQHDDRWDGDETSASRTWAAWRLADFFSANPYNAVQQPGLLNINGITRDGGAALRAALTGFKFRPDTTSNPLGDLTLADDQSASALSRLQIDKLIAELQTRLNTPMIDPSNNKISTGIWQTGAGPFWERGELSELPGFGRTPDQYKPDRSTAPKTYPLVPPSDPASQTDLDLTNMAMSSKISDRGREEVFRRLVEMTTTRGNVFTVYALGQAINQTNPNDPTTKRVTGTHQLKVTFRLVPKLKPTTANPNGNFHPGTDDNNQYVAFDAGTASSVENRFAKPDYYEVQILSVNSGNG